MTNTAKRILTAACMVVVAVVAAYFGLVRWMTIGVAVGMTLEVFWNVLKTKHYRFFLFLIPYFLFLVISAYFVGSKPFVLLLLMMIIAATDTGAWFFGRMIGGDKMWPSVSPNKTWAGQIAGIICGTGAAVLYGLLGNDVFLPSLMWIGIGVALMSQYGDLAMSALKRKMKIKDFSNILPGHGGLADRFDGWLFVLPIVWLAMIG